MPSFGLFNTKNFWVCFGVALGCALAFLFVTPAQVSARTVSDIQKEIEEKQNELDGVTTSISSLEQEIEQLKLDIGNSNTKRAGLNKEIELMQAELKIREEKILDLEQSREIKLLEQEKREVFQDKILTDAYLNWKQNSPVKQILDKRNGQDVLKIVTYQATISDDESKNIENLASEIDKLKTDLESERVQMDEYEVQIVALNSQIVQIQNQLSGLDEKVNQNTNDVSNYRARASEIQSSIKELSEEQRRIQEQEKKILTAPSNGGTKALNSGDLYFRGVGREIYQGHGVGMSQFGALGAALKGWSAEEIVEFYYPGAKVVTLGSEPNISVKGYGTMGVERYVAGAGEVPDFACEEIGEEFDPSNLWKCWPKEAIKAQIIAHRSYGLATTKGGGSICTGPACQVYKGGNNKQWAADETRLQVLQYGGETIPAYYSSDNHNLWGTANVDTVWSNLEGDATPIPYLQAVDDRAIAYYYTYTDWGWRTNGYSIKDIERMLAWNASSSGSYSKFMSGVMADVGTLNNLAFERDPSGRVNKVVLYGDGGTRKIAGWLFKSIWNIYVANQLPSGEKDYIYSLTYYLETK